MLELFYHRKKAQLLALYNKKSDISYLFDLLREGKFGLATYKQTFKYKIYYSIVQLIEVDLDMIFVTYLSDFQFLTSYLFISLLLECFFLLPYLLFKYHYPDLGLLTLLF